MRPSLRARLAEHFELSLTVVGVLVALLLMVVELDASRERMGMVFLIWLQGFLLWAVRRHSCLSRQRLVARLRAMLQDRVNNQLTVMLSMADGCERSLAPADRATVEQAILAARTVSDELAHLSVESLQVWEARYGHLLPVELANLPKRV